MFAVKLDSNIEEVYLSDKSREGYIVWVFAGSDNIAEFKSKAEAKSRACQIGLFDNEFIVVNKYPPNNNEEN